MVHCLFLKGNRLQSLNNIVSLLLKIRFVVANIVDPDEMLHYAAFHLGLHCLLMYIFRSLQYAQGGAQCLSRASNTSLSLTAGRNHCVVSLSIRHVINCLVLVQHRKAHPNMTEKLLTGM